MPGRAGLRAVASPAVRIAGLASGLGAAATAIGGANILLSLLLAGVAYLLSRVRSENGTPAKWGFVPRATGLLITFTIVYIVIVDLITSGNSSV